MTGWAALAAEFARWQDAGLTATLWWRDDDAGPPGPRLGRLLALGRDAGVPLWLAVVPAAVRPGLAERLAGETGVAVLQHGFGHRNVAAPGSRKSEFPDTRPPADALAALAEGWQRLATRFGGAACPVLVPPWNRIAEALLPLLRPAGYRGLSRYRARAARRRPDGLAEANTHVDPVDWRGGGGFAGEDAALALLCGHLAARRRGEADPDEPTGILTHHLVHDEAAWRFLERLFAVLRGQPVARWLAAPEVFRLRA